MFYLVCRQISITSPQELSYSSHFLVGCSCWETPHYILDPVTNYTQESLNDSVHSEFSEEQNLNTKELLEVSDVPHSDVIGRGGRKNIAIACWEGNVVDFVVMTRLHQLWRHELLFPPIVSGGWRCTSISKSEKKVITS